MCQIIPQKIHFMWWVLLAVPSSAFFTNPWTEVAFVTKARSKIKAGVQSFVLIEAGSWMQAGSLVLDTSIKRSLRGCLGGLAPPPQTSEHLHCKNVCYIMYFFSLAMLCRAVELRI